MLSDSEASTGTGGYLFVRVVNVTKHFFEGDRGFTAHDSPGLGREGRLRQLFLFLQLADPVANAVKVEPLPFRPCFHSLFQDVGDGRERHIG